MSRANRAFYRQDSDEVVIVRDNTEVVSYASTEALIETHIKGMLAIDQRDAKAVAKLLAKYRPSDVMRR